MTTTEEIVPEDSSSVKRWRFARWFGWFVWAYFTFVLIVLTLAFFLLLFNADPDAGFAAWVYRSADRAMEPFRGIFPTETAGNGSVIDFSILFAMIVYGILAGLVHSPVFFRPQDRQGTNRGTVRRAGGAAPPRIRDGD